MVRLPRMTRGMKNLGEDRNILALPNHSKLAKYKLSSRTWEAMADIKVVLGVRHKFVVIRILM